MFKQLGPDAWTFSESSPSTRKASTKTTFIGCSPPSPPELLSSTSSALYRKTGSSRCSHHSGIIIVQKDPKTSPLLCTTKQRYFTRLFVAVSPHLPEFRNPQLIASEDVNVEHLLDIFTSIDVDSVDTCDARVDFIRHLYWHKARRTVLNSKVQGLSDGHPSKPDCLFWLSRFSRRSDIKRPI
jgi:hypothetical protein